MNDPEKRLAGYRRLIEIARDLASTLDLDILLNRIVHAAADITEAEAASILLYDDAARQLHFQVATNLDEPTRRGLVVPLDGSIAGWIVVNRQPVRSADAHEDPRFYQNVEQATRFTTESLLGVPLINKDKIVGVLEAINKRKGDFTETDEDLLTVLGAQAAVAIENARLFQQSDLIAEFVHELRTPLASIGTSTYLLLRPEMSQEQREQMIHNIHGETLRLNSLASSFLDLARLESGRVQFHLTNFDLAPLLEECKQIMQGKADESLIAINLEIPPGFPRVDADRDKMKQLALNLLSNAIKYNSPQGTVTLRAGLGRDEWTLAVQDTGMGIPEKSLPHMFEKFYRVRAAEGKAPGTGLGLSICKQIVSGHGGSIEVKSKLGEGTMFTIHMPVK
ncbi:MAG: His Kinase A (phosphoacceptor) domain protein [Anaerolineaceae bacterium]|nr:MAG: His Kinase A (phosphoacceptor) domain protein [Anaerolineaceae bacterium]